MKHCFTLLMVALLGLSVSSPLLMPINRLLFDLADGSIYARCFAFSSYKEAPRYPWSVRFPIILKGMVPHVMDILGVLDQVRELLQQKRRIT